MLSVPRLIAGGTTVAALALAFAVPHLGASPQLCHVAALALFTIGLYATDVVPGHVTALLFFLIAMLFAVAPAETVFAGFQSAALWLVFGGLIVGLAVERTGLGLRLARLIADALHDGYLKLLTGVVVIGLGLSFIMPSSMGRIVLVIPIATALAEEVGFARASRGYNGVVLAAALGVFLPPFAILPSNIPNVVLAGAAESLYGQSLAYGSYLLLHLPVLGILKAAAIVLVVAAFYPDKPKRARRAAELPPMTPAERNLAIILFAAVALWATDFIHGVSPAWVALGAGLACVVPRFRILPLLALERDVNYGAFLYVAGVISLGTVVSEGGLGDMLGEGLVRLFAFRPEQDFANFFALGLSSAVLGLATTQPGIPAVMSPLAAMLANATGLSLVAVLMVQVIGFSTVLLPYQTPPLVLAVQLGGLRFADMARCTLTLAVVSFAVLVPLDYLWWRLLGYFG